MLKPMFESAIQAEVFATVKKKKKEAAEIASKPRTALLQEGENDVTVCDQTIAPKDPCSKPKIEAVFLKRDKPYLLLVLRKC